MAAAGLLVAATAQSAGAGSRAKAEKARASGQRIDVVLRLTRRQSGLQKLARAVTDPTSPRYGRYVDPKRTARMFGARKSTRRHVRSFLRRRGIRARVDVTRSFAEALVPARKARRLFGSSKQIRGRVPGGLRGKVRAVLQEIAAQGQFLPPPRDGRRSRASTGVSGPSAPQLEPPHVRTGTPAGCEQGRQATFQPPDGPLAGPAFTPNQIQTAYGASGLHAQGLTGKGVRAAVVSAGGFALPELRAFAECFEIEVPPTRLVNVGTRRSGKTSGESALDLQMLTLIAPGLESLVVYDVGPAGQSFFATTFSAMLEPRNAPGRRLPHVISVSQGDCESDLTRAQLKLTEHVLAATAAAGIMVAAGSGDAGSFCTSSGVREGFYPASSRWATSVGGTSLALEDSNEIADEIVWNDSSAGLLPTDEPASGGGGFSRYLKAPFYQRGLASWGDRRGYPDVAAMADLYPGIARYCGEDESANVCDPSAAENPFDIAFGTSTATPLLAGVAALANQRRLEAGAPPLGFPNPLLYELGGRGGAGVLRDVVQGSNDLLGFGCCEAGPGYDLASGWGSVDAEGLATAAGFRAR
jgi:subtilase family serine protease